MFSLIYARVAFSLTSADEEESAADAAPSLPSEPVALEGEPEGANAESVAPTATSEATEPAQTAPTEIDPVLERKPPTAPAPPPEDDSVGATDERPAVESPKDEESPQGEEGESTAVEETVVEQAGTEEPADVDVEATEGVKHPVIVEDAAAATAGEAEDEVTADVEPETEVAGKDKCACTSEWLTELFLALDLLKSGVSVRVSVRGGAEVRRSSPAGSGVGVLVGGRWRFGIPIHFYYRCMGTFFGKSFDDSSICRR